MVQQQDITVVSVCVVVVAVVCWNLFLDHPENKMK